MLCQSSDDVLLQPAKPSLNDVQGDLLVKSALNSQQTAPIVHRKDNFSKYPDLFPPREYKNRHSSRDALSTQALV